MTTTTYDIFELAKDLKEANVSEKEINAFVKFEKAKDEAILNTLITKDDLKIAITIAKKDIIIWLCGINMTFTGIIISAIAYLK